MVFGGHRRGEHVEVHVHEVVVQDDRERRGPDVLAAERGDHGPAGRGERRDRADGAVDGGLGHVEAEVDVRELVCVPHGEGSRHRHRDDILDLDPGADRRLHLGAMTRKGFERGGDVELHRRTVHRVRCAMRSDQGEPIAHSSGSSQGPSIATSGSRPRSSA